MTSKADTRANHIDSILNAAYWQPENIIRYFIDAFKIPSAAAAIVNGRPTNGTLEWKLANGHSYKEWEAGRLANDGEAE